MVENKQGYHIFGHLLKGWNVAFAVMYSAIIIGSIAMAVVAVVEEKRIRNKNKL